MLPYSNIALRFLKNRGSFPPARFSGTWAGTRHYKSSSQDDPEVGNTKHFDDPIQAGLNSFKDDPLVAQPGKSFHYSTRGYTLVGCVIEGASGCAMPVSSTRATKSPVAGWLSSAEDRARFEVAILNDKLIRRSSRDLMWTPLKPSHGSNDPYALGWGWEKTQRSNRLLE